MLIVWQDPRRAARVHGAATVRRLPPVRAHVCTCMCMCTCMCTCMCMCMWHVFTCIQHSLAEQTRCLHGSSISVYGPSTRNEPLSSARKESYYAPPLKSCRAASRLPSICQPPKELPYIVGLWHRAREGPPSPQVRAQDARARRHHARRLLPLGGHRLPHLRPERTLSCLGLLLLQS